ncbi:MAG: hypothetical protein ACI9JN_001704 [Bacteroidia bacterium]|jgi:hypothetical protein
MKYLLLLFFTTITTVGLGQNHYVNESDTNFIHSDTITIYGGHHGTSIFYYFKDSLADGKWILTYDSDSTRPQHIYTFKNKQRNGQSYRYDREGGLSMDGYYINDILVHHTTYYFGKITWECLGNFSISCDGTIIREAFNRRDKLNYDCRSMKNGSWVYSSRKKKRWFLKRLKAEMNRREDEAIKMD